MPTPEPRRRAAFRLDAEGVACAMLFVDGVLDDLVLAPDPAPSADPRVGEIHAAQVDRVMDGGRTGRRAAFLRAGGGATLYLPDAETLTPGERLAVEVVREPEGAKAARASRRLTFPGRWLVHTPGAPGVNVSRKLADADVRTALTEAVTPHAARGGFVIRTRAAEAAVAEIAAEAAKLADRAGAVLDAVAAGPGLLRPAPGLDDRAAADWGLMLAAIATEPGLARRALETLEALGERRVALDDAPDGRGAPARGAWAALDRTEALIAVDVNTGENAPPLQANLAALRALPRQLRLRGWGGIVVIDLAPCGPGDQPRLQKALSAAADPALSVAGFGPVGLLEATRRRDRPDLAPWRPALTTALAALAGDAPA